MRRTRAAQKCAAFARIIVTKTAKLGGPTVSVALDYAGDIAKLPPIDAIA